MESFLTRFFMSDEAPSPFKGIYLFFEFIALGFILTGVEQIVRGELKTGIILIVVGGLIITSVTVVIARYRLRKSISTATGDAAPVETIRGEADVASLRSGATVGTAAVIATGGELYLRVGSVSGFDRLIETGGNAKVDAQIGEANGPAPRRRKYPDLIALQHSILVWIQPYSSIRGPVGPSRDLGVSTNQARHHLDELSENGYVDVKKGEGWMPGEEIKIYSLSDKGRAYLAERDLLK